MANHRYTRINTDKCVSCFHKDIRVGLCLSVVTKLMTLLALLLLSGCTSLTTLFFYPQKIWISTPEDFQLEYQDVWLTAADNTQLHSWWIPAQSSTGTNGDTMVLYLHGNAENISSHALSVYWLAREGVDVLALDYRGFGASEGQAMLPSVLQDIEAAVRWMRNEYPNKQLVIVAQSIGTALAVNFVAKAAEHYQIDALVLDAPFASFASVARSALSSNVIGWLVWPFTVLVPAQWDPIKSANKVPIPTLIMHSPDDKVVPYKQGRKLYQAIRMHNSPACWIDSQGAHVASFLRPEIREHVLAFIKTKKCLPLVSDSL